MAEFVYTTSSTISGPWLIDADKLEDLDEILNEHWTSLHKRNQDKRNTEIEEQLSKDVYVQEAIANNANTPEQIEEVKTERREILESRYASLLYHFREARLITIRLGPNKRIEVDSFDEAFKQQILMDEIPTGFRVELVSGDIRCEIDLRRPNYLNISVSPEHLAESRELFAMLQRWANSCRAPKWQQIWLSLNGLQWFILTLIILFSLVFMNDTESVSKRIYRERARQLIAEGINDENRSEAIELLLAFQSGYVPSNHPQVPLFPWWIKLLLISAFAVCLILAFTPKSLIGLGKGQDRINIWRVWMRIVFVVIPGVILLNVILPAVVSAVFNK